MKISYLKNSDNKQRQQFILLSMLTSLHFLRIFALGKGERGEKNCVYLFLKVLFIASFCNAVMCLTCRFAYEVT